MSETEKMSHSEWELMRIIWTLGQASSRQVIELIQRKRSWSESTIKTLLGRLVKKDLLQTTRDGRNFIYQATIKETDAMEQATMELFDALCGMKKGTILATLIEQTALSRDDIIKMQTILAQKLIDAPDTVACDCVPSLDEK